MTERYTGDSTCCLSRVIIIEDTAESETFQELVATKYYNDQLDVKTDKQLIGAEIAQRLRLLKADLENEPFDLAAPEEIDIYDGDATTTASENTSDGVDDQ